MTKQRLRTKVQNIEKKKSQVGRAGVDVEALNEESDAVDGDQR